MAIHSKIEQIAYAQATSQVLSDFSGHKNGYCAYAHLSDSVRRGETPDDLVVWQPFEHWEWQDILQQIESEAESLLSTLKTVLSLAHQGIIQPVMDGHLAFDINRLDLQAMVELASKS